MIVGVNVEGQSLRWYDRPPKIADMSIRFVKFKFNLSPDWDGYEVTAQFTQKETYSMLLDDDYCDLPPELTDGPCLVSVFGYKSGQEARATVIPLVFSIEKSGFVSDGKTPIPPTPDLYAQYLDRVDKAVANSAPKIKSGTWWVWNASKGEYVDTKVPVSTAEGGGGIYFETDKTLILEDGILGVNTTDQMEQDNTLPITSAGVYTTVGNIEALLKTI